MKQKQIIPMKTMTNRKTEAEFIVMFILMFFSLAVCFFMIPGLRAIMFIILAAFSSVKITEFLTGEVLIGGYDDR